MTPKLNQSATIFSSFASTRTVKLVAGVAFPLNLTGNFIRCVQGLYEFECTVQAGNKFTLAAGLGFKLEPDELFTDLELKSEFSQTIKIVTGKGSFSDSRLNIVNGTPNGQIDVLRASAVESLFAGDIGAESTQTFALDPEDNNFEIIVCNRSATIPLILKDGDGASCDVILPNSSNTYPRMNDFKVRNDENNGNALAIVSRFFT